AENTCPRFALLGGDLVHDGYSELEWEQFFTAATPTFQQIPLLPAPGNHDDTPLFWKAFALPQNGPEGFKEKFYSFDYGNCHIAVLDSNLMGASATQYNTVKSWLQNDLDTSGKQWKFLVFHYPPYPVVEDGHSYNIEVNWVPLFEQCGVDVVFVGHQHVYMRTKPLRSGQVQADGEGIVYIMGNAGTKFYPAGDSRGYIAKELDYVSSYQLVSIDGDTFTMSSRDADGQIIDSYTLGNVPLVGAAYSVTPLTDAAYQTGTTTAGIAAMTVNQGISGMKYFGIELSPVRPHEGLETAVFVHLRNGAQLGLNATQADFDMVNSARAGFNVEPGDTVKAYVVDDLSNALDRNPVVLQ
ncbi:MAG: metallophosphoesterase, partial [Syntrophomonas sp.]